MRCIVIGALPVQRLPFAVAVEDYLIAADKGYETAVRLGLTPQLVVGDFDSLGYAPKAENVVRLNVRKDDTDVGHALAIALERGCTEFHVFGALGGKLDHTIANVQLAANLAAQGASCTFYGDCERFTVLQNNSITFGASHCGRISVFSLLPESRGVSIRGLSYCCENVTLTNTFPLGVSNEFVGANAEISVSDGRLLVMWQEGL